jgi:hypothetical protein
LSQAPIGARHTLKQSLPAWAIALPELLGGRHAELPESENVPAAIEAMFTFAPKRLIWPPTFAIGAPIPILLRFIGSSLVGGLATMVDGL